MTSDLSRHQAHAPPAWPPWRARLDLRFAADGPCTRLVHKRHRGPMVVQRPFHPEGAPCHVYLLHPPGGIVGGDELVLDARLDARSHALLTMPGATKFYRSAGPCARVRQHFHLQPGSRLEWLPQDSIAFPGARARIDTDFHLAEDSRLLCWESVCLGRPVLSERFTCGRLDSRLRVHRRQRLLLHERLLVDDGQLAALGHQPVSATLLAFPATPAMLDDSRALLDGHDGMAGATCVDDLLIVRLLGHDSEAVQQHLRQLWQQLRPPLLGCSPCPPRIWQT